MMDLLPEVNVLGFVESNPGRKEYMGKQVISGVELQNCKYDYVILANCFFKEILDQYALDMQKTIIYPFQMEYGSDGKIIYRRTIDNPMNPFYSQRELDIVTEARTTMPYISIEKEDLKFIFNKDDNLIPSLLIENNKLDSIDEMLFLAKYAKDISKGLFFDIGANVGTTSITFKKKIANDLKYYAFEPLKENYKCLKLNCIINDCEDIVTINKGLSNSNSEKKMHIYDGAFGSSYVAEIEGKSEVCSFVKLDDFMNLNGLNPQEIALLWVDVQCHELEFVEGAFETLNNSPANMFIEFNMEYQKEKGTVTKFVNLLSSIYKSFICYEQYEKGNDKRRNIEELEVLVNELDIPFCNVLLFK